MIVLVLSAIVACGKLEGADSTPQGLGAEDAVDANAVFGRPTTGNNAGNAAAVSINQLVTPNASLGVALRWRADPSKCVGRSNGNLVDGDSLVLVPCASNDKQAWSFLAQRLYAGASAYFAVSQNSNAASLRTNALYAPLWTLNADKISFFMPNDQSLGSLWADPQASGTTYVRFTGDFQGANSTLWDLTAVGATASGTLLSANGNSAFCVAKKDSSVVLATCNAADAAQRWSYVKGGLLNDAGGYLVTDETSAAPQLYFVQSLSSGSSRSQTWSTKNYGFRYVDNVNYDLYLAGDTNTRQVYVDSTANGVIWILGGKISAQ